MIRAGWLSACVLGGVRVCTMRMMKEKTLEARPCFRRSQQRRGDKIEQFLKRRRRRRMKMKNKKRALFVAAEGKKAKACSKREVGN